MKILKDGWFQSCNVYRKIFAAVKLTKKQRFIFSLGWPIHIIKIFD